MDQGAENYRRYLSGDDEGFAAIIREYAYSLTLYLNSFVLDLHTAEDLAEDVFVKLLTKKPHFAGKSSFKTWLFSIGRNLALDDLRRRARRSETDHDPADTASTPDNAISELLKEEQKIAVFHALSKLRPEYRQVITLIYLESMTNLQTAEIMHKSKRQIENLHYRAKSALKNALIADGFLYEDF